ncbi:Cys/Met metabolism, pyridoxal phosphate-dependent enzyme, partial [human gut metagenome]
MEIFKPGDHIIIDEDLYGGSIRLFHSINVKNGLTFTSVDLSSVDVEDYIQDNTKAIYAETPTNPMMRVSDLEELYKER